MTPLNHMQIEGMLMFVDPATGNVIAAPKNDPSNNAVHVFGPRTTVEPVFYNLLAASATLYQTLSEHYRALGIMMEPLEAQTDDPAAMQLHRSLSTMQDGLLLAQQVALEGMEKVAKSLDVSKRSP